MNDPYTCPKYVVPKLQAAGWQNDLHSLTEQKSCTDARVIVVDNKARWQPQKRAGDTRDFPIAVVEAAPPIAWAQSPAFDLARGGQRLGGGRVRDVWRGCASGRDLAG